MSWVTQCLTKVFETLFGDLYGWMKSKFQDKLSSEPADNNDIVSWPEVSEGVVHIYDQMFEDG